MNLSIYLNFDGNCREAFANSTARSSAANF